MERRQLLAGVGAAVAVSGAAYGETYPSRVVTLVVPFGPGSGTDVTGRILIQHLSPLLGQGIVIENKVGATGMIAAKSVAQAAADGYTLLFATNSTHGSNPSLFKSISYDPVMDFAPVGRLGAFGQVLVVGAHVPVRTVAELVSYARANPDALNYGTGNSGSHIMAETFKRGTGIRMTRVPYRSTPAALTDLVGGRISVMFADLSSSLAFIQSNTLRALAVTSLGRSAIVPSLPTLHETVLPGFDIETWTGILAPARTPPAILARLNAGMNTVLQMPEVRQRLLELGVEPQPTSPDEFGRFIRDKVVKWGTLVREAGIEAA